MNVAVEPPAAKRTRTRPWDGAPLECVDVRDEAPGVKTFCLAPTDGSRLNFHAGQNLTLEWPMGGETLARTFTIASPPTQKTHVELTVKAHEGGRVTNDLHRSLVAGRTVRAHGPGGRFGLAFTPAAHVLMLSAGSGITPMMSMLRMVRDRGHETDISLIHAAASPADFLFVEELREIAARCPNVRVTLIPSAVPASVGWIGPRGRLSRRALHALVPDVRDRTVFLCGPPAFRAAMRRALLSEGIDRERVIEESFLPLQLSSPPAVASEATVTITLGRSGRTIDVAADRTLYETLKCAGITLQTGCRSGICGTCRTAKRSGVVAMRHQGGLSTKEEQAGQILPCCSYPLTPLTLDL